MTHSSLFTFASPCSRPSLYSYSTLEANIRLVSKSEEGVIGIFFLARTKGGREGGRMMTTIVSHQCGPSSIPGLDVICRTTK